MADPVDEYAVQLLEEFEMKLKTTMKEGLGLGDENEKKTLDERRSGQRGAYREL